MAPLNDEVLMKRAQEGDPQSFEILYTRYHPSVLSYLHRLLGNLADAEPIGQEVFRRALGLAPTYRYPQKFSTWLFIITRNLAIHETRRRKDRLGNRFHTR